MRAWANSEKFQPGTSLRAWLFTILRNIYYSNYRKRSREVQDSDGLYARRLTIPGDEESHLDLEDFRSGTTKLPAEQREVLTLIGASGLSYEEAAVVCQVGIGTIKSRLSRARAKLVELLKLEETSDAAGRASGSARWLTASLSQATVTRRQNSPHGRHQRARRGRLLDDRTSPFNQAPVAARLPGIENERDAAADQPARNRRRRVRPKTEIENHHGEIIEVRPRHRLVQGLAEANDNGARLSQSILQIHRHQRIVFDDQHPHPVQRMIIVRRLNHGPVPAETDAALSEYLGYLDLTAVNCICSACAGRGDRKAMATNVELLQFRGRTYDRRVAHKHRDRSALASGHQSAVSQGPASPKRMTRSSSIGPSVADRWSSRQRTARASALCCRELRFRTSSAARSFVSGALRDLPFASPFRDHSFQRSESRAGENGRK